MARPALHCGVRGAHGIMCVKDAESKSEVRIRLLCALPKSHGTQFIGKTYDINLLQTYIAALAPQARFTSGLPTLLLTESFKRFFSEIAEATYE